MIALYELYYCTTKRISSEPFWVLLLRMFVSLRHDFSLFFAKCDVLSFHCAAWRMTRRFNVTSFAIQYSNDSIFPSPGSSMVLQLSHVVVLVVNILWTKKTYNDTFYERYLRLLGLLVVVGFELHERAQHTLIVVRVFVADKDLRKQEQAYARVQIECIREWQRANKHQLIDQRISHLTRILTLRRERWEQEHPQIAYSKYVRALQRTHKHIVIEIKMRSQRAHMLVLKYFRCN